MIKTDLPVDENNLLNFLGQSAVFSSTSSGSASPWRQRVEAFNEVHMIDGACFNLYAVS